MRGHPCVSVYSCFSRSQQRNIFVEAKPTHQVVRAGSLRIPTKKSMMISHRCELVTIQIRAKLTNTPTTAMHYFTLIVISAQKMLMRGFDTKLREVYQVGNDFWRVIAPIPVTLSFIWISQKAPLWRRRTRVDINAQRTDWTACARSSVHLKELFVIKNQCITSTISAIRRRNRQKCEERRRNVLSCFTF